MTSKRVLVIEGLEALSSLDWKGRGVLAVLAGAFSMLAMPPFFCWTVLFITLPALILLLDGAACQKHRKLRAAFFIGWCFGFGYFFAGFYWVYHAFLVDGDTFGWLIPIIVPLLPALLALFYGLAGLLAVYFWAVGAARIVVLALSFALVEWVRGHIFTGFPWHSLGYAFTSSDALAQSAALFGLYGLTMLVVLIFSIPVLLLHKNMEMPRSFQFFKSNIEGRFFIGAVAVFVLLYSWGALRLWSETQFHQDIAIRIVQPNIVQKDKWNRAKRKMITERFMALTKAAVSRDSITAMDKEGGAVKTLVVWPESAMPFLILREASFLQQIGDLLPKDHYLLMGNVRLEAERLKPKRFYNSMFMFDSNGEGLKVFDKKHLIPFGEYMPLKSFFSLIGLKQLANAHGAFQVGGRPRYIKAKGIPAFAPLLCYEVIFPDEIIEKGKRPDWLLNLTNDAWYGHSDGPKQHLHYSRIRSIEQGLPMVRATNTGISAIIDAKGKVVSILGLGKSGVVEQFLPRKINPTLYARFGVLMFAFMLVLGFLLLFITKR